MLIRITRVLDITTVTLALLNIFTLTFKAGKVRQLPVTGAVGEKCL